MEPIYRYYKEADESVRKAIEEDIEKIDFTRDEEFLIEMKYKVNGNDYAFMVK